MKTWRFKDAERRKAVKEPRAILSVAFPGKVFDMVDSAAEKLGVYTSEFVRQAALERARRVLGTTAHPEPTDVGSDGERWLFGGDYTRTSVSGHAPPEPNS